jgi:predicted lipase
MGNDEWHENRKLVIDCIERHQSCIKDLYEKVSDIKTEIAVLKIKASIWGLLGGAITIAITMGVWYLKSAK